MKTINCKGNLIDLSTPRVMGILNLTPDSFYDGGKYGSDRDILLHVEKMLLDGATFIDMGAYSSRPGADAISMEEEKRRLLPVLEKVIMEFPEVLISVDTFRASVAKEAVAHGGVIINDITGGLGDAEMLATVAQQQVPYILMHMRGTPQTMKGMIQYNDLVRDILFYFSERLREVHKAGINDVIIDPGFGFAKNSAQNFELLDSLELFEICEAPVLVGLSRKSTIYKTLNITAEKALNGTTALNMVALRKGVSILRVHDVAEAMECIKLSRAMDNTLPADINV